MSEYQRLYSSLYGDEEEERTGSPYEQLFMDLYGEEEAPRVFPEPEPAEPLAAPQRTPELSPATQPAASESTGVDTPTTLSGGPEKPTRSRYEEAYEGFGRGMQMVESDHDFYLAAIGLKDLNQVQAQRRILESQERQDPLDEHGVTTAAARMAGPMIQGSLEGGIVAAGAVALGQAGPQVALPEEIITAPLAFAVGSGQYWYRQGAGAFYKEMLDQGIDPDIASSVAQGAGVPYALIEGLQVGRIIPAFQRYKQGLIAEAFRKTLQSEPVRRLISPAVEEAAVQTARAGAQIGREVGEEVLQELTQVSAEEMGKQLNNAIRDTDLKAAEGNEILKRGLQIAQESVGPMALLMLPATLIGGTQRVSQVQQAVEQYEKEVAELTPQQKAALGVYAQEPEDLLEQAQNGPVAQTEEEVAAQQAPVDPKAKLEFVEKLREAGHQPSQWMRDHLVNGQGAMTQKELEWAEKQLEKESREETSQEIRDLQQLDYTDEQITQMDGEERRRIIEEGRFATAAGAGDVAREEVVEGEPQEPVPGDAVGRTAASREEASAEEGARRSTDAPSSRVTAQSLLDRIAAAETEQDMDEALSLWEQERDAKRVTPKGYENVRRRLQTAITERRRRQGGRLPSADTADREAERRQQALDELLSEANPDALEAREGELRQEIEGLQGRRDLSRVEQNRLTLAEHELDEVFRSPGYPMSQIEAVEDNGKRLEVRLEDGGQGSDYQSTRLREAKFRWSEKRGAYYAAVQGRGITPEIAAGRRALVEEMRQEAAQQQAQRATAQTPDAPVTQFDRRPIREMSEEEQDAYAKLIGERDTALATKFAAGTLTEAEQAEHEQVMSEIRRITQERQAIQDAAAGDVLERSLAEVEAQDAIRATLTDEHYRETFKAPIRGQPEAHVIIAPAPGEADAWRVTRFDERGPSNHTEASSYEGAVAIAQRDYRADLTAAEFAEAQQPPERTYEQWAADYREAFSRMNEYTPKQVGSQTYAERMADLADERPDYLERFEAEEEQAAAEPAPTPQADPQAQKLAARMREQAQKVREKAEAKLGEDRLTNTPRRARMAGHAEDAARKELQVAETMERLAEAHEQGTAPALAGVKAKVDVETLQSLYMRAAVDRARAEGRSTDVEPSLEDIPSAKFPWPRVNPSNVRRAVDEHLKGKRGMKKHSDQLRRLGAGDNPIDVTSEADLESLEVLIKQMKKGGEKYNALLESMDSFKRVRRMGITPDSLQDALTQFAGLSAERQQADPIVQAERELAGTKIPGYFPTPPELADRLVEEAQIEPGMSVLEPSAGKGNILDAMKRQDPDILVSAQAIEPVEQLRTLLKSKGYSVAGSRDFLEHHGVGGRGVPVERGGYDRIVMNPPFENNQDIEHVRHAYDLLKPGGRLVSIMGEGAFFRQNRTETEFREWLEEVGGISESLPEGSFKSAERPTGVATRMVVIDKPSAAEGPSTATEPEGVAETEGETATGKHVVFLTGSTRDPAMLKKIHGVGFGRVWQSTDRNAKPAPGEPWGLDNGVFTEAEKERARRGEPYDLEKWLKRAKAAQATHKAQGGILWANLPDVYEENPPAGIRQDHPSLKQSLRALEMAKEEGIDLPWFLTLQDGMDDAVIEQVLWDHPEIKGLFLGGSKDFKQEMAAPYANLAHRMGRKFHYGRAGTKASIDHAMKVNADYMDSAFPLWKHERMDAVIEQDPGSMRSLVEQLQPEQRARLRELVARHEAMGEGPYIFAAGETDEQAREGEDRSLEGNRIDPTLEAVDEELAASALVQDAAEYDGDYAGQYVLDEHLREMSPEQRAELLQEPGPIESRVDEFVADLPKVRQGKVRKDLRRNVDRDGRIVSRQDLVEELVAQGHVIAEVAGERVLQNPETETFVGEDQISKTAMDYAAFLTAEPSTRPDFIDGEIAVLHDQTSRELEAIRADLKQATEHMRSLRERNQYEAYRQAASRVETLANEEARLQEYLKNLEAEDQVQRAGKLVTADMTPQEAWDAGVQAMEIRHKATNATTSEVDRLHAGVKAQLERQDAGDLSPFWENALLKMWRSTAIDTPQDYQSAVAEMAIYLEGDVKAAENEGREAVRDQNIATSQIDNWSEERLQKELDRARGPSGTATKLASRANGLREAAAQLRTILNNGQPAAARDADEMAETLRGQSEEILDTYRSRIEAIQRRQEAEAQIAAEAVDREVPDVDMVAYRALNVSTRRTMDFWAGALDEDIPDSPNIETLALQAGLNQKDAGSVVSNLQKKGYVGDDNTFTAEGIEWFQNVRQVLQRESIGAPFSMYVPAAKKATPPKGVKDRALAYGGIKGDYLRLDANGREAYSDGSFLVVGDAPVVKGRQILAPEALPSTSFEAVIPTGWQTAPVVTPVAYARKEINVNNGGLIFMSDGLAVGGEYFDWMRQELPNAEMRHNSDDLAITFVENDEVVGLLMGVRTPADMSVNYPGVTRILPDLGKAKKKGRSGGAKGFPVDAYENDIGGPTPVYEAEDGQTSFVDNQPAMPDPASPAPVVEAMPSLNMPMRLESPEGEAQTARKLGTHPRQLIEQMEKVVAAAGDIVPIRVAQMGRAAKKALGYYKVQPEVIRLRQANDIPVAAHETGHALEKAVFGDPKGGVWRTDTAARITKTQQKELEKLGHDLYGGRYPVGGYRSEGFAEYLRYFITTDSAQEKAPAFHAYFTGQFAENNPDVWREIEELRRQTLQWRQAGAQRRTTANVVSQAEARALRRREAIEGMPDRIVEDWIDILAPVERLKLEAEAALAERKKAGLLTAAERALLTEDGKLKTSRDPYTVASALRLTHDARVEGWVNRGMTDLMGNQVGGSLMQALAPVKDRRQDFTIYLYARRALAMLNDPQGQRNPGISEQDAMQVVQELETPEFQLAAQAVYDWNDGVLNYLAQSSPTFKMVVDKIRERDPGHYIPLQREFSELERRYNAGGGGAMGSPVQRLRGSGRRIKDPFVSMIAKARDMSLAAHQRLVTDQIVHLANTVEGLGHLIEKVPRDEIPLAKVGVGDIIDRLWNEHGLVTGMMPESADAPIEKLTDDEKIDLELATMTFFGFRDVPKGGKPIVPVRRGDNIEWYYIEDPALYDTLQGMEVPMLKNKWVDLFLGAPARMFRLGTTGLRASFSLIWNPARDLPTMLVNSKASKDPLSMSALWFKSMGESFFGAMPGLEGGEYYDAFIRLGGQMAQPLGQDVRHTDRAIRQIFADSDRRLINFAPRKAADFYDFIRDFLQFPETAPRLAELRAVGQDVGWEPGKEMTFEQSVQMLLAAKQVTTDFTAAGKLARTVNQMVPFFNASIQGPRVTLRRLLKDRDPKSIAMVASIAAASLALWWENKDEEWYQRLPYREKFLHWHFNMGDEVVRVPRPFEIGTMAGIPEALMMGAWEKDPEAVMEWLATTADVTIPPLIEVASFDGMPVPVPQIPLVAAAMEQFGNYQPFWDRPIVPRREENRPAEEQFNEYTTRASIVIGDAFNVSPRRVEHLVRSLMGGVGVDAMAAVAGRGEEGRGHLLDFTRPTSEMEWADVPLVGRAFLRGGTTPARSKQVDQMYDYLEQATERQQSIRTPETERERQVRLTLLDAQRGISALYVARNETRNTEARRRISQEIANIASDAVELARSENLTFTRNRKTGEMGLRERKSFTIRKKEAETRKEIALAIQGKSRLQGSDLRREVARMHARVEVLQGADQEQAREALMNLVGEGGHRSFMRRMNSRQRTAYNKARRDYKDELTRQN